MQNLSPWGGGLDERGLCRSTTRLEVGSSGPCSSPTFGVWVMGGYDFLGGRRCSSASHRGGRQLRCHLASEHAFFGNSPLVQLPQYPGFSEGPCSLYRQPWAIPLTLCYTQDHAGAQSMRKRSMASWSLVLCLPSTDFYVCYTTYSV